MKIALIILLKLSNGLLVLANPGGVLKLWSTDSNSRPQNQLIQAYFSISLLQSLYMARTNTLNSYASELNPVLPYL